MAGLMLKQVYQRSKLLNKPIQNLPYCGDLSAINKLCHHLINRYNASACRYNVSGEYQICQGAGQ
jgi:hypothetical protein